MIRRTLGLALLAAAVLLYPWQPAAAVCLTPIEIDSIVGQLQGSYPNQIALVNDFLHKAGIADPQLGDSTDDAFAKAKSESDTWGSFQFSKADANKRPALLRRIQDQADLGDLIIVVRQPDEVPKTGPVPKTAPVANTGRIAILRLRKSLGDAADWDHMKILMPLDPPEPTSHSVTQTVGISTAFNHDDADKIEFFLYKK